MAMVIASLGAVSARAAMEPAVPVRTVAPAYPDEMRRAGISGVVSLYFVIDESGNVENPKVMKSTNAQFEQPALDAIRKWKFKPARRDGKTVKMQIEMPIQFRADSD